MTRDSAHRATSLLPPPDGWPAFESTIERYQRELHAFAYRIMGGSLEAEDALQEALIKAFLSFQSGDAKAATSRSWLYRVVYSCCVDQLRRASRNAHDVLDDSDQPPSPGSLNGSDASMSQAISRALLGLPPPMRAAVLLVDVHGLTYDEAAVVLEVPRGTIASRLNHGRRTLRGVLTEYARAPERR